MYFEQNTNALLRIRPDKQALIEALRQAPLLSEDDFLLLPTPEGECAFRYKGVWLHAKSSPIAKVRQAFTSACKARVDRVHVIIGLGLGYALEEATHHSPAHTVIVYEPDLSLLRFTLENVDLQALLGNERVQLVTKQTDLLNCLKPLIYAHYDPDFLLVPGEAQRFAAELPILSQNVQDVITDWQRNYRSLQRFHPQWVQRFFENLPNIVNTPALDDLADYYAGKPALIISRGPSLDDAIEDVARLEKSAVLVVVGAALHCLWQANITPDFAIFYDMNGMDEQLHGLPESYLSQITFVMSPFVRNLGQDYAMGNRRVLLCQATQIFAAWLDDALQTSHKRLQGGGSVSIAALQLALFLGCTDVALIGQDLAFPNDQVYAGGISVQKDEQGCLNLAQSDTLYMAEALPMSTIQGQNGESLQTLTAFTTYARQLVAFAQKVALEAPHVHLWNASLGGAQLDGYSLTPLSTFHERWPGWKDMSQAHPLPSALFGQEQQKQCRGHLHQAVQRLLRDLEETQAFCRKHRALLPRDLSKTLTRGARERLEDTVWLSIQQLILHLHEKPFIEYLLQFQMTPFKQRFRAYKEETRFDPKIALELSETLQKLIKELDHFGIWIQQSEEKLSS
jgi:hypothetical protein